MVPLLVRVAVPLVEFRITPAAGRPKRSDPPVRPTCQPPFTDPPDAMLTITSCTAFATIPVLNCPVVKIFVAFTCTVPVGVAVNTGVDRNSLGDLAIKLVLSAKMPTAPEPLVVIGPEEVTLMLPPPERAAVAAKLRNARADVIHRDWRIQKAERPNAVTVVAKTGIWSC